LLDSKFQLFISVFLKPNGCYGQNSVKTLNNIDGRSKTHECQTQNFINVKDTRKLELPPSWTKKGHWSRVSRELGASPLEASQEGAFCAKFRAKTRI
jgi:hypothetical protein